MNPANLITISRIILALSLLFIKPCSFIFYLIYTICGLTDILDGYIARKINKTNAFGAKLDSLTVTDMIFLWQCS